MTLGELYLILGDLVENGHDGLPVAAMDERQPNPFMVEGVNLIREGGTLDFPINPKGILLAPMKLNLVGGY